MSSSSSQEIHQEQQEQEAMEWLPSFLKRTFFGACSVHPDHPNNDLNRYCISCQVSTCKHCIASGSHGDHNLIKIYRHVYKDVVPLGEMRTYINCTMIQQYRCNKKMVISLNPLPHCGSGKGDKDGSCHACMRKLTDSEKYHYCSIACKFQPQVTSSSKNTNDSDDDDVSAKVVLDEAGESQSKRRHRRKGIPCRAPRF